MREKAPGSGGPAAGKPEGVKSGAKLFEQVKESIDNAAAPPESAEVAPAAQDIRKTNPDGSASRDDVIHTESQEESDRVVADEMEKIDDMTDGDQPNDQSADQPRERGKPSPGKARRTSEEVAEDEAAEAAEARKR